MATLDLMPAVVDVDYYRNDGKPISLDFGAVNVSAYTFLAQIKATRDATSALGVLTPSFATNFKAVLTPDSAVRALSDGIYFWDVQYISGSNPPVTVCGGLWRVHGDVSR